MAGGRIAPSDLRSVVEQGKVSEVHLGSAVCRTEGSRDSGSGRASTPDLP